MLWRSGLASLSPRFPPSRTTVLSLVLNELRSSQGHYEFILLFCCFPVGMLKPNQRRRRETRPTKNPAK